ncbi:MAG: HlyU family transcriptional regulator [Acidiferrobacterales bacterium]
MLKFLRKLAFGKGHGDAAANQEPVLYNGYTIVPTPQEGQAGWTTEGIISKEIDGVRKSQRFIRADTSSVREQAVSYSILKAQKIIDEQGDALFGPD